MMIHDHLFYSLFQVFLILWWWFLILLFVGILRIVFRIVQINSARLRFYLLKLRMNRYFKRSKNMDKVRNYIYKCSRGDWFVLYQLSKNLNRPFFMEFLVKLSRSVDPETRPENKHAQEHRFQQPETHADNNDHTRPPDTTTRATARHNLQKQTPEETREKP